MVTRPEDTVREDEWGCGDTIAALRAERDRFQRLADDRLALMRSKDQGWQAERDRLVGVINDWLPDMDSDMSYAFRAALAVCNEEQSS